MKGYLCIDIGGTTIKSGIFNADGNILEKFPLLKTNNADESLNIVNSVKYLIKKKVETNIMFKEYVFQLLVSLIQMKVKLFMQDIQYLIILIHL